VTLGGPGRRLDSQDGGAHRALPRRARPAQKDYLRWKQEMLAPFAGAIRKTGNGLGFDTLAMPAILDVWAEL
jgi:hypothetical protein